MKKYQIQLVDTIANIHCLYEHTKDTNINKHDKEFIENLVCTVEHYFKEKSTTARALLQLKKSNNLLKIIK